MSNKSVIVMSKPKIKTRVKFSKKAQRKSKTKTAASLNKALKQKKPKSKSKKPKINLKSKKPKISASAKLSSKNLKATKTRKFAKNVKNLKNAKSLKNAKKAKVVLNKKKASISVPKVQVPIKRELSKEVQELISKANVRHWLIEVGGENALEVLRALPMVSDDEGLAKKFKIKVSDVRTTLNKLHNEGMVAYVRNKNSETGWYSYTWMINEDRIKRWVEEKYTEQQSYAPQEGVVFYFCKNCGLESAVRFEVAAELTFKCQNCNSALDFLDKEKFEQFKNLNEEK